MNQIDKITSDLFGGAYSVDGFIPEISMLPMKRVLNLWTGVPEHANRLNTILKLSGHPTIRIPKLQDMLNDDLSTTPTASVAKPGSKIIKPHTSLWAAYALYWPYGFNEKLEEEIQQDYHHRIGDISLKYIEYYHRIKQQENSDGDNKHKDSFYEFIAVGKARAIEFLVEASKDA